VKRKGLFVVHGTIIIFSGNKKEKKTEIIVLLLKLGSTEVQDPVSTSFMLALSKLQIL
jgi:hypothetical protein